MRKRTTVKRLIKILSEIDDKDLPVYIRPKYTGTVEFWEEIPVNPHGISCMIDKKSKIDRVVFLI